MLAEDGQAWAALVATQRNNQAIFLRRYLGDSKAASAHIVAGALDKRLKEAEDEREAGDVQENA